MSSVRERLEAEINQAYSLAGRKWENYYHFRVPTRGREAIHFHYARFLESILADLQPTPPTLGELRASGEWFLVLYQGIDEPLLVNWIGSMFADYLGRTCELFAGDKFKRICDPDWTEVPHD